MTGCELTRRDALAALAAAGVAVGGGAAALRFSGDAHAGNGLDETEVATLVAVAEVLYPSRLDGVDRFVEGYVRGRVEGREDHAAGIADAVAYLDEYAIAWYDERFAALDRASREEALRGMSADAAEADPEGSSLERLRHYVIDELLFALYSTPTGGELVGIENPPGHPGGLASYQQGPRR